MGLSTDKGTSYGAKVRAKYFRIEQLNINYRDRVATVVTYGYIDRDSSLEKDVQPLVINSQEVRGEEKELFNKKANGIQEAYKALRASEYFDTADDVIEK